MKITWFVVSLILVLLSAREAASDAVDDLSKDSLGPPPRTDVGFGGPEYQLEGRFEGRKGHGRREKKGNEGRPKKGWGGWFGNGGPGKGFKGRFEGPGFKGGFDGGNGDGATGGKSASAGSGHP